MIKFSIQTAPDLTIRGGIFYNILKNYVNKEFLMASWMIHLRIADKLLDRIPGLCPIEFIMGNMAPDSGVPNEDWTAFSPSTQVSHFRADNGSGKKKIDLSAYLSRYFTEEQQKTYSPGQFSFYLGYLTHLLADLLWSDRIAGPTMERFAAEFDAQGKSFWNTVKEDWYDLDFLYLKQHPGFRAFRAYLGSVGFVNTYMDFFAPDAFDNRREYITGFYLQDNPNLDRVYPYLTEAEVDRFVEEAAGEILASLRNYSVNI